MADPPADVEVRESRLGAALYEPALWFGERLGMARRRRALLASARGTVVEIGAGTGLNLRHYPAGLERLVLVEPARRMAGHLDPGRAPQDVPVDVVHAPAERLPFADASVDTVVSTLVLCTVTDPAQAVAEIVRVLRPDGQLLFLEHVAASARWRHALQRRLAGPWAALADGCRCDRPTLDTIGAQLPVASVEHGRWRGMPAIVRPLVWGVAVRATTTGPVPA